MISRACRPLNQPTRLFTAAAPTNDQPVSAPQSETAATAAADVQDSALWAPATSTAAVEPESKSDVAPAANTEPGAAPSVAAVDPGKDWRQDWTQAPPTAEQPNASAATPGARKRVARAVRQTIEKKAWLARTAVRPRRVRRIATAVAVRTIDQNNGFAQSNFQTEPQAQAQLDSEARGTDPPCLYRSRSAQGASLGGRRPICQPVIDRLACGIDRRHGRSHVSSVIWNLLAEPA